MNKFLTIISVLVLFATNSFSQIDPVDFSQYKYPDLNRHELVLNYDLFNELFKYRINDNSSALTKNSQFNFNNEFTADYFSYRNSRKYQGSNRLSLSAFMSYSNDKHDSSTFKINRYVVDPSFSGYNRMYLNEKWFYELNYALIYQNNDYLFSQKTNGVEIESGKSYQNLLSFQPEIAFGYGRVETVTDVVHAIIYFKNLIKNDRLQNKPDQEGIFEFAKLLANLKNERFFDSREKKIYELEKIDSFLTSRNYINKGDIKYFTVIDDIWEFAGKVNRGSGSRISFSMSEKFDLISNRYDSTDSTSYSKIQTHRISPTIKFSLSKPVSALVQRDIFADLGYDYTIPISNTDTSMVEYKTGNVFLNIGFSFGFYPNTRTYIKSSLALEYGRNSTFNELNGTLTNIPLANMLDIHIYYYISPRFRYFLDSGFQYSFFKQLNSTYSSNFFNYYLSTGLQFALF
jgi:hypothetical protein